jgi:MarR family transcriptional regulator, 2-MHQ and catechol-resistance regulon repressor
MPTHYKGNPEIERALSAYINFIRAANSIGARLETQIESSGMTTGQFAVLEALHHLGSMSQCALAQKLLRSGGNVTVVIDNLEKRGWVRRERLKHDRRMVVIHLTPAGRRLIAKVFPEHARAIAAEMNRLSPEDQETLRALCRTLGGAKESERIENVPPGTQEEHHG